MAEVLNLDFSGASGEVTEFTNFDQFTATPDAGLLYQRNGSGYLSDPSNWGYWHWGWAVEMAAADSVSATSVWSGSGGDFTSIICGNGSDADSGYLCWQFTFDATVYLGKNTAPGGSTVATGSRTVGTDEEYTLSRSGSDIEVVVNGTSILTYTDGSPLTGKWVGVMSNNSGTPPISSLVVDDLASAGVAITDDFNRANQSDLGNGWDNVGRGEYGSGYGLNIVGNQAEGDVDWGVCREIYGTPATTAASFSQADFIDVFSATSWQVGVNVDPAVYRGGYWLDKYEWYSEWYLYRNGTTVVTQGGYASGVGWTEVRLEHDGAGNLTASEGGVEILTYTDGSPLTTNKYFGIAMKGGHIDNFSGGDLSAGGPPTPPLTVHGGALTVTGSGTLSIMTGAGLVAV